MQQRLGQQAAPGLQVVQAGQPGTQVQVVQQINTAGQVVHKVTSQRIMTCAELTDTVKVVTVPQNPGVQPGQPPVSGGQVVQPHTAAGTQIMQTSMGQLTALGKISFCGKYFVILSFKCHHQLRVNFQQRLLRDLIYQPLHLQPSNSNSSN